MGRDRQRLRPPRVVARGLPGLGGNAIRGRSSARRRGRTAGGAALRARRGDRRRRGGAPILEGQGGPHHRGKAEGEKLSAVPIPQIHYRRMRASDLSEVAALEKSLYAFPWSLGNFRDSVNAGYDCWTVTHGEAVIGYAILMVALDEAHLLNIAIASAWQAQGIGRDF